MLHFFARFFSFLDWRSAVNRQTLAADLIAGVTGAVIVLPQGIAFASIAGLPVEYGLYSAIVPVIVAALFGSSHHLISGPTTAISIVIFSKISFLAAPFSHEYIQLTLTLTFIAGAIQLALGLARFGAMVNFVSHSVVVGFTSGAALLIASNQLGAFFGITIRSGESILHTWIELFHMLPQANLYTLLVALTTLVSAVLLKHFLPRLPGLLMAMVAGSLVAMMLDGKTHGIAFVGALSGRLPPPSLPDFSPNTLRELVPGALAVAMLGLAEAVSIARSVATSSHQRIDNNREFIGQGLSNIVGSFFSSYASSGSFTRSGVNYSAGAKTPMAAVFAAVSLALIVVLVAPLTAYLPVSAMAGILLFVAYSLIDLHHIRAIFTTSKPETMVLGVTFLSTLFLALEFAIFSGVILSLLLYLNRTSHPHFITVAPDPNNRNRFIDVKNGSVPECDQLKFIRIDGSIFFGAVNHIAEELHHITKQNPTQRHIVIIGSGINFIDVSGCEMLFEESRNMHLEGRELYMCSLKEEVVNVVSRSKCAKNITRVFRSKHEAVEAIVPLLDKEQCHQCKRPVFRQCEQGPAVQSNPEQAAVGAVPG